MFVQLLITLAIVWFIAEALCRLVLGLSVTAATRELFGVHVDGPRAAPGDAGGAVEAVALKPNAALRRLLSERRRKLAETGDRLELTAEAAEIAEQLARRDAELAVTECRLAETERRRSEDARD